MCFIIKKSNSIIYKLSVTTHNLPDNATAALAKS